MIRIHATAAEFGKLVRQCARTFEAGQCFHCPLRDACLAVPLTDPPHLRRIEDFVVPEPDPAIFPNWEKIVIKGGGTGDV